MLLCCYIFHCNYYYCLLDFSHLCEPSTVAHDTLNICPLNGISFSCCSCHHHSIKSNQVVVCNIHVLYNPNRGDIKIGQVSTLFVVGIWPLYQHLDLFIISKWIIWCSIIHWCHYLSKSRKKNIEDRCSCMLFEIFYLSSIFEIKIVI